MGDTIEGIDNQLKDLDHQYADGQGNLLTENYQSQRRTLYERKAQLVDSGKSAAAPVPSHLQAIETEIKRLQAHPESDRERNKQIAELYSKKAELLQKNGAITVEEDGTVREQDPAQQQPQANTAEVDAKVESTLRDKWGSSFESRQAELYETVSGVFNGNDTRMLSVINSLPASEQIAAAENISTVMRSASKDEFGDAGSTVAKVEQTLRGEFGRDYDATMKNVQRVVSKVWGSTQNFDNWCSRNGFTRNATSQCHLVRFLNGLSRSIK